MIDWQRHAAALRLLMWPALAVVTWLTLTPKPVPLPGEDSDKLAHAAAFFLLALLSDIGRLERPVSWQALALLAVYGAAIEVAQHYVPNRSMSAADLLADVSGLLLYALLAAPWLRHRLTPRP